MKQPVAASPPPAAFAPSAPPSLPSPPPLAVPLGYGSGPTPPLLDVPAVPVYRQHMQRPPRRVFHHVYHPPLVVAATATPRTQCAGIVALLKLLLFNAANGALGVAGFTVVSVGLLVSLVALPLCCFGVVLARVLLRVVYALCYLDAHLHNLVADADDKIQFRTGIAGHSHPHSQRHGLTEHQSLLPTHVDWQLQPHHLTQLQDSDDNDQLPQFEPTLADVSPRAVLATIYFGSVKYLVGLCSLIALGLVALVLAIFVDGDDVQAALAEQTPELQPHDPLTLYGFALGLAIFAVAMLVANARLSQALTRFFCCEGGGL